MSRFPAIPDPQPTVESLYETVILLKQAVEVLTQQRTPYSQAPPSWQDLVDLDIVNSLDVPTKPPAT